MQLFATRLGEAARRLGIAGRKAAARRSRPIAPARPPRSSAIDPNCRGQRRGVMFVARRVIIHDGIGG
jgi:hypothetical protein